MIYHQSPYGQVLKFSTSHYYGLSDAKLAEIEQNCANIDRETIVISSDNRREEEEDSLEEL